MLLMTASLYAVVRVSGLVKIKLDVLSALVSSSRVSSRGEDGPVVQTSLLFFFFAKSSFCNIAHSYQQLRDVANLNGDSQGTQYNRTLRFETL